MPTIDPGLMIAALDIDIPLSPITEGTTFGSPSCGDVALDTSPGTGVGVWEMTPGDVTERERAELVIVLKGHVTVDFLEPDPDGQKRPSVELRAGSIIRLEDQMLTCWTVHETVRKVFILP